MSYINRNTKVFLEHPKISVIHVRSEARLKNYISSPDTRAWCDIVEDRRQHILEYAARNKEGTCFDKDFPLESLFDAMMACKNHKKKALQGKIDHLKKLLLIYPKIKLTADQEKKLGGLKDEIQKAYEALGPLAEDEPTTSGQRKGKRSRKRSESGSKRGSKDSRRGSGGEHTSKGARKIRPGGKRTSKSGKAGESSNANDIPTRTDKDGKRPSKSGKAGMGEELQPGSGSVRPGDAAKGTESKGVTSDGIDRPPGDKADEAKKGGDVPSEINKDGSSGPPGMDDKRKLADIKGIELVDNKANVCTAECADINHQGQEEKEKAKALKEIYKRNGSIATQGLEDKRGDDKLNICTAECSDINRQGLEEKEEPAAIKELDENRESSDTNNLQQLGNRGKLCTSTCSTIVRQAHERCATQAAVSGGVVIIPEKKQEGNIIPQGYSAPAKLSENIECKAQCAKQK